MKPIVIDNDDTLRDNTVQDRLVADDHDAYSFFGNRSEFPDYTGNSPEIVVGILHSCSALATAG